MKKAVKLPCTTSVNWLCSPVLQEELQHYWANDGSFIYFIIKWGQKFCVGSRVNCGDMEKIGLEKIGKKPARESTPRGRASDEESSPEPLSKSLWTNSRLRSSWITPVSGGSLSLKHMVVTTSMKKLLHLWRNRAFFAMAALGEG